LLPSGRAGGGGGHHPFQVRWRGVASYAGADVRPHRRVPARRLGRRQPSRRSLAAGTTAASDLRPVIVGSARGTGCEPMIETSSNIVLHAADVQKYFGGLRALSDIDLQIEEGKTHAIIGPNGAGKSTLLNVIVGRIAPTSGAVVFDGVVLTGRPPHEINQ